MRIFLVPCLTLDDVFVHVFVLRLKQHARRLSPTFPKGIEFPRWNFKPTDNISQLILHTNYIIESLFVKGCQGFWESQTEDQGSEIGNLITSLAVPFLPLASWIFSYWNENLHPPLLGRYPTLFYEIINLIERLYNCFVTELCDEMVISEISVC